MMEVTLHAHEILLLLMSAAAAGGIIGYVVWRVRGAAAPRTPSRAERPSPRDVPAVERPAAPPAGLVRAVVERTALPPDLPHLPGEDGRESTVLLVDDRWELRAIHATYLEEHGYRVLTAGDGVTALDLAREHRPSVIVLDYSLPRLTGVEVARQLKDEPATAQIPIVLMTAHSYGAVGSSARAAGCAAFLAKPCPPNRVLQEVARLSSAHAPAPPPSAS